MTLAEFYLAYKFADFGASFIQQQIIDTKNLCCVWRQPLILRIVSRIVEVKKRTYFHTMK